MRKGAGISAGLVAILALAQHTQFPSQSERSGGSGKEPSGKLAPSAKRTKRDAKPRANELKCRPKDDDEYKEGPWFATRAFFHRPMEAHDSGGCPEGTVSADNVSEVSSDLAAKLTAPGDSPSDGALGALLGLQGTTEELQEQRKGNWSIVATLPDPLHSRLALTLDMQVDTLVRSFESAGWSLSGQWLPWLDPFDPAEKDIVERHKGKAFQRDQEELPGILIFRSDSQQTPKEQRTAFRNRVMFVFVVGEIPTNGISAPPFFAALHMARFLAPAHKTGLLAPTYSGSFVTLTQLVQSWRRKHPDDLNPNVFGGATSSFAAANAFEKNNEGLHYFVGIHDLDVYRFGLAQLQSRYGLRPDDVAVLTEDNSGYGQAFKQHFDRHSLSDQPPPWSAYRTYAFPRDISHLRNAYREAAGSTGKDAYSEQAPRVGFSLKDADQGEDSVPMFSAIQTPLAQEAALLEIVRDIERNRVRLVFIAASNSLDGLFLARLLQRESPDVRVVLDTPHVLFVAAALRESLTGLQFLSTYPLSFVGESWLEPGQSGEQIPMLMASSDVQGLYNASLLLLENLDALPNGKLAALRAYRQPRTGKPYPPLWLLTLDRYGLRPLDLFDVPKPKPPEAWHLKDDPRGVSPAAVYAPLQVEYPVGWMFAAGVVSLLSLLGCGWIWMCNRADRAAFWPIWLYLGDAPHAKRWLLGWVCLSWSAFVWVLCAPAWHFLNDWTTRRLILVRGEVLLSSIAFLAPILVAIVIAPRYWAKVPSQRRHRRKRLLPLLLETSLPAALLFLSVVVAWGWLCFGGGAYGSFLCTRALTLVSGSSPALPLALLCAVSFCFAVFRLKRCSVAGGSRPRLKFQSVFSPVQVDGRPIEFDSTTGRVGQSRYAMYTDSLNMKYSRLSQGINGEIEIGSSALATRLLLGLAFAGLSLAFLHPDPQAAERPAYNWALFAALGSALFWLFLICLDFLTVGRCLQDLLNQFEFMPLLPAFRRMVRDWPHRPIWTLRGSVPETRLRRQWLRSLYCRLRVWKDERFMIGRSAGYLRPGINPRERERECELINAVSQSLIDGSIGSPRESGGSAYHELQYLKQQRKAAANLADMILRYDLHPAWLQATHEAQARGADETPFGEYIRHASDYVAMVLFQYISYAVEQLRRIAECISIAFLLLVLCLNCYHPQGPRMIGRFLAVLFVAAGCVMIPVFARLDRNAVISCISRGRAGKLSLEFWLRIVGLGGLPLLAVLSHLFPEISGFLSSYLAPSLESLH